MEKKAFKAVAKLKGSPVERAEPTKPIVPPVAAQSVPPKTAKVVGAKGDLYFVEFTAADGSNDVCSVRKLGRSAKQVEEDFYK